MTKRLSVALVVAACFILLLGTPTPADRDARPHTSCQALARGFFRETPGCADNRSLRRGEVVEAAVATVALTMSVAGRRRRAAAAVALMIVSVVALLNGFSVLLQPGNVTRAAAAIDIGIATGALVASTLIFRRRHGGGSAFVASRASG